MANSDLNFANILDWALAASAAYDPDEQIRDKYGSSVWSKTLANGVKVFVATDTSRGFQWLSVRGTDDYANVREDAEYLKERDARLGIYLHDGFHRDAQAVYDDTRARLDQRLPVRVTGHSLGGAVAAILQAWLRVDGFSIDTTLTFGQPKVTDEEGVLKLRAHPLLRVINDEDVVPMIPPLTLLSALHGPYRHFGQELHLGPTPPLYQLYTEHDAETPKVTSFWCNLCHETPRDHHVALYVAKLEAFCAAFSAEHRPAASLAPAGAALPCTSCGDSARG
jgi:triacylglycerol lipase